MRKSHLSYGFLLSLLTTILLLQWWQLPAYPLPIWLFLGCLGLLGFLGFFTGWKQSSIDIAIVLGIGFALATVQRTTHITTSTSIESFDDGNNYRIHGFILDEPDVRPMETKFTVTVDALTLPSGQSIPVTGRILAVDHTGWPPHGYGDEVTVSGKIARPRKMEDFDYAAYLSLTNVYSIVEYAKVSTIAPGKAARGTRKIFAALYALKSRFESQINRIYPEPHASLLAGLLTGSRRGIPAHLTDDFRRTGLAHIIAISGSNVTIMLAVLSSLLFWLPLKWRFVPLTIGIVLFTLFVGASSSVVRAAIMGILGLIALQSGRQSQSRLLILWAAAVMLLWNPKLLWYDAGFQLSFLAVIGIAELGEPLGRILRKVPTTLGLRASLITTLAAQIATLPLTVWLFGQLSLIAPLSNLLVAPLIPYAMLLGFTGTVVGSISFQLGQLIAYVGWGFLELIIIVAKICAAMPYSAVRI